MKTYTHSTQRLIFFTFVLMIVLALSMSTTSTGATPAASQQPASAAFVIQLRAAPVAEVYAQQVNAQVRAADVAALTQAALATVEAEQLALLSQLDALDATVLYRTQRVFNGIAVRIDPAKVDSLRTLPGVRAVYPLIRKEPNHANSLPVIGAPDLWQGIKGNKLTGEGIRIAVIDTGIDYVHSDLGGTGNFALYALNDRRFITDSMPYPNSKVVAGYDFVGEDYDADPESATYQPIPKPDADPMDCYGHGTHVAGTVAGSGVLSDGTSYTGTYNKSLDLQSFRVAPGVAPKAQVVALKVFGCQGSSEVTDLAIEWAVDPNQDGDLSDHVDVINLSLGSSYGVREDVSTIAANNAAAAGVIVVASAGNSGDVHYITGSPAVADRVISVAASDHFTPTNSDLLASFSSRGPRRQDSVLKPDIAAPGVNIRSALYRSGSSFTYSSGTSMAAPHVAGSMALLRQFHPDWTVQELKALVMNSAQPTIQTSTNVTSAAYSAVRVGAGRIDLNAAVATTLLAYDVDSPELVSLSFGSPQITTTTLFTRTLAIHNKGKQPVTVGLDYFSQVDLPGADVTLPQSTITLSAQSVVTVPIVLKVEPLELQRSFDQTLREVGLRYWLSEEVGLLEIVQEANGAVSRVPLYANPRPVSQLELAKQSYDFGTQAMPTFTLTLSGTALSAIDAQTGTNSLVSVLELQWQSTNNDPVEPNDPRLVVGSYDAADIRFVGIANNLSTDKLVAESTIHFGIASYADWSSPKEVQFQIFIDTDEDGNDDYRVFNSDQSGAFNDRSNSDRFVVAIENLNTGAITTGGPLNNMAASVGDAALFGNNLLVIPVRASLIGLTQENSEFGYRVESEIAEMTGIVDRSPKLYYALNQQAVESLDGNVMAPTRIVNNGEGQVQTYLFNAPKAGGTDALLIFFHHNQSGKRTEIVHLVSDIPKLYLPIIRR